MPDQNALFQDGELAEAPEKLCTDALAVWNEIAPKATWPEARFLTQSRRSAMRRALKDYGGLLGWRKQLERAATSDFLTGKSSRDPKHANWRPDLDWFLKPANIVKVLENKFRGAETKAAAPQSFGQAMKSVMDWDKRLANYKPGGWWHVDTEGPRPESDGAHKVPPEKLAAWRAKHRIVREAAPETAEARLAAMIVSYRKIGRHGDANRLEEQLAALQGRAPVLLPAPDARNPDTIPGDGQPTKRPSPHVEDIPYDEVPEGDYMSEEPEE